MQWENIWRSMRRKKNPTETLLELTKLTFPNNFFKFDLKIVKQKLGYSHWG